MCYRRCGRCRARLTSCHHFRSRTVWLVCSCCTPQGVSLSPLASRGVTDRQTCKSRTQNNVHANVLACVVKPPPSFSGTTSGRWQWLPAVRLRWACQWWFWSENRSCRQAGLPLPCGQMPSEPWTPWVCQHPFGVRIHCWRGDCTSATNVL